jgi:hypothetical protein
MEGARPRLENEERLKPPLVEYLALAVGVGSDWLPELNKAMKG